MLHRLRYAPPCWSASQNTSVTLLVKIHSEQNLLLEEIHSENQESSERPWEKQLNTWIP